MSILPDWLTGYDAENAQRAAAADAKLSELNKADYQTPGGKYYSAANAAAVTKDYATQATFGADAQRTEIDQAFTDTLDSQAKSIIGGPLGIAWATIKSILGAIPWWIWAAAGLALFVWLGGITLLRGSLAKKK